jgi:trigger factor
MTASTLTRLAPTEVALEFTITDQELAAAEERAFRKLARDVRLPGFRKGHVPRKIFEQAYGSETLTSQAVDDVIPDIYAKALREHELDPVDRPKLEVLERNGSRPTKLRATVEVRPPIELDGYKGIPVRVPSFAVSDEEVERSLSALAKERATLVPVTRPAQMGDLATLDYAGTIDGVPFEGGQAEGQTIELNEGRFVPGFATGIAGMQPGERRDVEARFPDDYPVGDLAGKPATFAIVLHELKEFEMPPIDDDFARTVSNDMNLEELRAELRRRLESVARARSRRVIANSVMDRLVASHDIPLPSTMVENEIDRLIEDAAADSPGGAAGVREYVERSGKTEDEVREGFRPEAQARVKSTLLVEAIAKKENLVATPADISAEVEVLARRYGQPATRVRKALGSNILSLMDGIVRNKTLELLVDNAQVVTDEETPHATS